jgi:hypothetical protein
MGDVLAGNISKGVIHQKVDATVNHMEHGRFDLRAKFLAELKRARTSEDYLRLIIEQAGVRPDEADYMRKRFYKTDPNPWWPDLPPTYPIVRQGLIKAIEEAGDTLPLDSYWLPGARPDVIEVIVCKSPTQVTRIFLTPPVPNADMRPRGTPKNMWAIGQQSSPPQQVGNQTGDALVEAVDEGSVTWRRLEFP